MNELNANELDVIVSRRWARLRAVGPFAICAIVILALLAAVMLFYL
jgi:hypothetical protein